MPSQMQAPRWEQIGRGLWIFHTGTHEYGRIEYHFLNGYQAIYDGVAVEKPQVTYALALEVVMAAYRAARAQKGS